ncbi:class C sortase [Nocardioides sp. zg-536]|uniref:Class C sortase n=1 Tax=Nocardioides faecalis TaxID=2803858 RepID=A0A938YCX1_9ACTN|nr:class C sortase [Nocardioides faecalis]MBM9461554.1 class C sortase [Nocardioides faecalis]QVI57812.1 class C sortase [Nocardioides faecalis]
MGSVVVALLIVLGSGLLLYPSAASWFSAVNQAEVVESYKAELDRASPKEVAAHLRRAKRYNAALTSGALLEAGTRKPSADGTPGDTSPDASPDAALDYDSILDLNGSGVMGHVVIPDIDVDLPLYHGTSDEVLRKGAGHLEGSHLPVGGRGTLSVIAAHRGLPTATMFDDLDHLELGDRFIIDVFGTALVYEITSTEVVDPDETEALRPVPGKDLVTLVTCTPLGVNSHRILVTGERVDEVPPEAVEEAGSDGPGFPWWALGGAAALVVALAQARPRRRKSRPEQP